MKKGEYEKVVGRRVEEIAVLLKAHEIMEGSLPKHLAQILVVCETIKEWAGYADGDLLLLLSRSVPKDKCWDKSCSGYGKNLVWGEDGYAVCSSSVEPKQEVSDGNP